MILADIAPEIVYDLWTITIAVVGNVACALLGCYLVLRRLSLLGDAISHGVLPGIAIGFLLSGSISGWGVLLGAMVFGLLTAFLSQTLNTFARVPEDASMGIVFTSLFALGVILLSSALSHVDLDPGCVFYGLLEFVPLDTEDWFGLEIPQVLPVMAVSLALTIGFIVLFWKELKIVSFDPALASAMGLKATVVHYLLMAMVAGVTVSSFSAVGSILVVAMLIVPGACAHLLSDRLAGVLVWAAVVAIVSSILGYYLTPATGNIPGMMAVLAGAQFLLAALLAPRHGVVARLLHNVRLALRIIREDILATLYRQEEISHAQPPPGQFGLQSNRVALWLARLALRASGHVQVSPDGGLLLTGTGRLRAQSLVRSHRLWEAYLDQNFELPRDHLHDPAMRMEHFIGPALQKELEAELHQPGTDPHGRSIPPAPQNSN